MHGVLMHARYEFGAPRDDGTSTVAQLSYIGWETT